MTFQYPITQLVLSHSAMETEHSCSRKFEQAYMFGKPGMRENMFAADVGNALHDGMQEWLISHDEDKALKAMLMSYPFETEYSRPDNRHRSMEACIATLEHFFGAAMLDRYELVSVKTPDGSVQPAIEVPFAIKIVDHPWDIPVYYVGFMDIIMYDRVEGAYLVVDIKTTRMRTGEVRYKFDMQVLPYGVILEHMLGHDFSGEFKVAYLDMYVDLEEPKLQMYPFTKTAADVSDWYVTFCDNLRRIMRYRELAWFPRASSGTTCYSFNKPCFWADTCEYRDTETLGRILRGEPRKTLFHDPAIVPWVEVELPLLGQTVGAE